MMDASEAAFAAGLETLMDGTAELYARHLGHPLPAVLSMEIVTERQRIYREMRATLVALQAFAEIADRTLGRERCRELHPAFDRWLVQIDRTVLGDKARRFLAQGVDVPLHRCGVQAYGGAESEPPISQNERTRYIWMLEQLNVSVRSATGGSSVW